MIRKCNLMIDFSKFTSNKKILGKFEGFISKLIWRETLLFILLSRYILVLLYLKNLLLLLLLLLINRYLGLRLIY